MAKFINPKIRFVDQFLAHFKPCFTKTQWPMFRQYIYAAFADYKRPSIEAFAEQVNIGYEKLQYFFSEADWNINELNAIRLKILSLQPTTRATPSGILAIDDTACPKPYAEKTEGAKVQYCAPLKGQANCNVAVASCFVSESKHFPVEFKSYLPIESVEAKDFKSKLDLAQDLVNSAIAQGLPISTVLVDNWYAASEFIEFVVSQNLNLISEVKSNRSILFTDPKTRQWRHYSATALAELIKTTFAHKIKNVNIPRKDGSTQSVPTYSFVSRIKDCSTKLKIIFVFDSWSEFDDQKAHVLISTDIVSSDKKIISTYLLRWGIEENFRELKDDFAFDQYQVRHQKQIQRHWILSFLAWSITYWIKQNGCLSKIIHEPPENIAQCKKAVGLLLVFDSTRLLSKNPALAASIAGIKSARFADSSPGN
jgi:hypothetical protein